MLLIVRSLAVLAVIFLGVHTAPQGVQPGSNATAIRNQTVDPTARLHDALFNRNLADVQAAIRSGADVNAKSKNGYPPITLAISSGRIEMVKLLLDAGANVNVETERGYTPLIASLDEKIPLTIFELLLKSGADIHYRNKQGETILLSAIDGCAADSTISLLLSHGANINDQLPDGRTTVMVAAGRGHCGSYRTVKMLIEAGVDLSIRNKAGKTALEQYIADVKYAPGNYSHFEIPAMLKLLRGLK